MASLLTNALTHSGIPKVKPKAHMRIKLTGTDIPLDFAAKKMVLAAYYAKGVYNCGKGPSFLPTRNRLFTLNKAPHIDKRSREQFQLSLHARVVHMNADNEEIAKEFFKYVYNHLPPGVGAVANISSYFDIQDLYQVPSNEIAQFFSLDEKSTADNQESLNQ